METNKSVGGHAQTNAFRENDDSSARAGCLFAGQQSLQVSFWVLCQEESLSPVSDGELVCLPPAGSPLRSPLPFDTRLSTFGSGKSYHSKLLLLEMLRAREIQPWPNHTIGNSLFAFSPGQGWRRAWLRGRRRVSRTVNRMKRAVLDPLFMVIAGIALVFVPFYFVCLSTILPANLIFSTSFVLFLLYGALARIDRLGRRQIVLHICLRQRGKWLVWLHSFRIGKQWGRVRLARPLRQSLLGLSYWGAFLILWQMIQVHRQDGGIALIITFLGRFAFIFHVLSLICLLLWSVKRALSNGNRRM